MTKNELSTVVNRSIAYRTIKENEIVPVENETLTDFVNRTFNEIYIFMQAHKSEPLVSDIISDIEDETYNAILSTDWRIALCNLHSPFLAVTDGEQISDADLLEKNGISKDLQKSMPSDAVEILLKKYRTPTKNKPASEIRDEMEKHFKSLEPIMPKVKKYVIPKTDKDGNKIDTEHFTRGYHWAKDIQSEYVKENNKFLSKVNIPEIEFTPKKPETPTVNS